MEPSAGDDASIILLKEKDAPELAALEAACFSLPWSEKNYRSLLRGSDASLAGQDAANAPWAALPVFTAFGLRLRDGTLAAYISLGLHHAAKEMEIYNIAVRRECRRQGHGARLLAYVLRRAAQGGMERALLEVRTGNAPALALYAAAGFSECGRRKKYYTDTGEDALVLGRELTAHEPTEAVPT